MPSKGWFLLLAAEKLILGKNTQSSFFRLSSSSEFFPFPWHRIDCDKCAKLAELFTFLPVPLQRAAGGVCVHAGCKRKGCRSPSTRLCRWAVVLRSWFLPRAERKTGIENRWSIAKCFPSFSGQHWQLLPESYEFIHLAIACLHLACFCTWTPTDPGFVLSLPAIVKQ